MESDRISCSVRMGLIKSKRGVTYGWLYLLLFIFATAAMLVTVVPADSWPDNFGERFITKFRNAEIEPKIIPGLKINCRQLGEADCLENLNKGCIPTYSRRTRTFLDCTTCPKYPTCSIFGKEAVCLLNSCTLDCKWVTGQYEGGYTILGRCIDNIGIAQLKRDLYDYGFDAAKLQFGMKNDVEKTRETDNIMLYKAEDDILVIEKNQTNYFYMRLSGKDAVAIDRDGNVVVGSKEMADEVITHWIV